MLPQLPRLPACRDERGWSANSVTAYNLVLERYGSARRALLQEDGDVIHLQVLLDSLNLRTVPVLQALINEVQSEEWADDACRCIGMATALLRQTIKERKDVCVQILLLDSRYMSHALCYIAHLTALQYVTQCAQSS